MEDFVWKGEMQLAMKRIWFIENIKYPDDRILLGEKKRSGGNLIEAAQKVLGKEMGNCLGTLPTGYLNPGISVKELNIRIYYELMDELELEEEIQYEQQNLRRTKTKKKGSP